MKMLYFISGLMIFINASLATEEITPYKFTDEEAESNKKPVYAIPQSSRFTTKRLETEAPDIVYYLSKPQEKSYPLAILCTGSSDKESAHSIIHFHRHFLQEFMDLGVGVATVEQWGIEGQNVDVEEFMKHYTWSQRLKDHQIVIEHLASYPPMGWNEKLIFVGASEGGPLVTTLTQQYSDITLATLNFCGADGWSWREQLWAFLQGLKNVECSHHNKFCECAICSQSVEFSREKYDEIMDKTVRNPTTEESFVGMTYKYHADALQYSLPSYDQIRTPFLVVAGEQDSIIDSCNAFVEKAREAKVPITYLRVPDMGHYIRKRPDIIQESLKWLEKILETSQV